eukprot:5507037-Pyramimonas_sp.AAC.1
MVAAAAVSPLPLPRPSPPHLRPQGHRVGSTSQLRPSSKARATTAPVARLPAPSVTALRVSASMPSPKSVNPKQSPTL